METAELTRVLDREGALLAAAAERAGTDAPVPTCPDWRVRDLLRHTGMVHRWAAAHVAEGHTSPRPDGGLPDLDGAELLAWFRDGHRSLVDTLRSAAPDVACWSFLPAPSPLAFWARRQAHETTVHRVDAESARGGAPTEITDAFAVDGIDELLRGFHARSRSRVRADRPRLLRVRATGAGADGGDAVWAVRLSSEPPAAEREDTADGPLGDSSLGDGDCEVAGTAAELYLALWNRRPFPAVTGDPAAARLWRERSGINWS
ncbi:maleylpyruvate isomerase family mycothiol-dependent enzyme [Streptomyces mangrovisoli]|uniref:Maleylpyruvate isomerase family mycothiol-dependent enzyme n=1 Tax=Streptomyces mangrovisoli TaxID=1428628 RepID=A0A1J4P503_9ACTN|nr:maleylpyruvate isomerase family mycothiol-dependent enzyme [Streptomyces mangrovisoli]OIJ68542.1 hypothetical protein WN71_007045 [Streptomyces mangrovisoli]